MDGENVSPIRLNTSQNIAIDPPSRRADAKAFDNANADYVRSRPEDRGSRYDARCLRARERNPSSRSIMGYLLSMFYFSC